MRGVKRPEGVVFLVNCLAGRRFRIEVRQFLAAAASGIIKKKDSLEMFIFN